MIGILGGLKRNILKHKTMTTKAKITWSGHPYGEALRLSNTNNRYQSMLPHELERLIHSYLYRNDKERRKQKLDQMVWSHASPAFADGQYYFAYHRNVWFVQKTVPLHNRCIYYTTHTKYIAKDWLGCMHATNLIFTMTTSMVEEEIEEKRQARIKLLGTLPFE